MNLDGDKREAESLLHELATELRRVPMCERTRELHIRALTLKREVSSWGVLEPGGPQRGAVITELGDLHRKAHRYRELPTGRQLAYVASAGRHAQGTT